MTRHEIRGDKAVECHVLVTIIHVMSHYFTCLEQSSQVLKLVKFSSRNNETDDESCEEVTTYYNESWDEVHK
ncbi:hypothetical protein HAX54_034243, partial [Datura stramonium]|nr:hypothetical protein [Datura stramonium]